MSCCNNYKGLFPHNQDMNLGIEATQTGKHKIHLQFAGSIVTKEITLTAGDDIVIERPFNESYLYRFTIEQPNGALFSEASCTDFSVKTYVNTSEGCGDDCYS